MKGCKRQIKEHNLKIKRWDEKMKERDE
jgi:hypothetical protein